jgi:hypothetical protein
MPIEPSHQEILNQVQTVLRFMERWYTICYGVHLSLGLCAIIMPALGAMQIRVLGLAPTLLAGIGSLAAATHGFIRPSEYATAFDNATQIVWNAEQQFMLGTIDSVEVGKAIESAIRMTSFRYTPLDGAQITPAKDQARPGS